MLNLSEMAREACRMLNLPVDGIAFSVIRGKLKQAAEAQRKYSADVVREQQGDHSTLYLISQAVLNERLPEGK